ncbi:MAG: flagellum-specific ATP synthase FliI, partial [Nitrosospira sp.]|nr:flagellum-specific ATP synthase FliI [Nitrosospira sp.]
MNTMPAPAHAPTGSHSGQWREFLKGCGAAAAAGDPFQHSGSLTRVTGLVMEAVGLKLAVGSGCTVLMPNGDSVEAEVVGFQGDRLYLMPTNDIFGLTPGAKVIPWEHTADSSPVSSANGPRRRRASDRVRRFPVGEALLGRVLDGVGRPLDGLGPLNAERDAPLVNQSFNPLDREPINQILDVGVRAINALLTVGRGQRMGLFAGSGVGKSVLLGMMARYTSADVIVVGLIGERGREVKEFIEQILGPEGMARSVVVAAPADTWPLMRLQGASYATSIAVYFRDRGRNVLLIMDSLTR